MVRDLLEAEIVVSCPMIEVSAGGKGVDGKNNRLAAPSATMGWARFTT